MKRILTTVLILTLVLSIGAFAQITKYNYQFVKSFPDTNFKSATGGHGVAVDPAGKVWIQKYDVSDSVLVGAAYVKCRDIYCYNPDGTKASFSPIKFVTVGGVQDTLWNSNRGMRADHNGNIVFAAFDTYYRLNYKTGVGMNKVAAVPNQTAIAPGFDDLNEMFTGLVIPSVGPIKSYDNNFAFLGNVVDTTKYYSRTLDASANGNDVMFGAFSLPGMIRYHSANGSLGPYSTIDTIMKGFDPEAIARHPKTGYWWIGGGDPTSGSNTNGHLDFTYYGFAGTNLTTPIDSFTWNGSKVDEPRPRAIAFSPTGDTVYVCAFNVSSQACVQMWKKGPSVVQPQPGIVATSFSLEQNYPNPFNPTTEIKFSVNNGGQTTLRVYDVLGREVSTLVNDNLKAGVYSVSFDASKLPSGTYFYTLNLEGRQISKKMMLLK